MFYVQDSSFGFIGLEEDVKSEIQAKEKINEHNLFIIERTLSN